MFCKNCGKEIPNNVAFCPGCGTPVQPQGQPQAQPQQPPQQNYYQPQPQQNYYQQPQQNYYQPQPQPQYNAQPAQSGFPVVSLILGIVGLLFIIFVRFWYIGLLVSIGGIVFGVIERKKTGKAVGMVLSIVGTAINGFIGIIMIVASYYILSFLSFF